MTTQSTDHHQPTLLQLLMQLPFLRLPLYRSVTTLSPMHNPLHSPMEPIAHSAADNLSAFWLFLHPSNTLSSASLLGWPKELSSEDTLDARRSSHQKTPLMWRAALVGRPLTQEALVGRHLMQGGALILTLSSDNSALTQDALIRRPLT